MSSESLNGKAEAPDNLIVGNVGEGERQFMDEYGIQIRTKERDVVYKIYPAHTEELEEEHKNSQGRIPLDRVHPIFDVRQVDIKRIGIEDPRGPGLRILATGKKRQEPMVIILGEFLDEKDRRYLQHRVT